MNVSHRLARGALAACAMIVAWSSAAFAQPTTRPPVSNGPIQLPATGAPGVLVLVNGVLVTGHIQRTETGFLVDLPQGQQVVPTGQVLVVARDKADAYRQQREAMRRPTPALHVALARWCLIHQMPAEAEREVDAALALAGDFEPARTLLRQIEQAERPDAPSPVAPIRPAKPDVTTAALVLVGGTLVEGRISETATGYFVDLPKGRYLVPFDRVLVAARDREEAYAKQRGMIQRPSSSRHFELAQWCMRYQMTEQAKEELRSALKLAGNYAPARDLLRDIEQLERPNDPRHLRPDAPAVKTADGFDVPDSVSISGLSPETAETFTSRIQPLLVNSCGNSNCHGGRGASDFELQHVRFGRGGIRVKTQQNLAATLKFVDRGSPLSSPLLKKPAGIHGGGRRPVFDGRGGRRQRDLLEAWIVAAARDLDPEARTAPETVAVTPRPPRSMPWDPRPRPTPPVRRPEPPTSRQPDLLDRILDEERPDAFDPDAFNRAVESRRPKPGPTDANRS